MWGTHPDVVPMTAPFVLIVTGWRGWPWEARQRIWTDLLAVVTAHPGRLILVRHGHCRRGVDMLADRFATADPNCSTDRWPAQWERHDDVCGTDELRRLSRDARNRTGPWCAGVTGEACGRAGDRRNRAMSGAVPRADLALAYPGPPGRSGTRNAVAHLLDAGIATRSLTWADAQAGRPTIDLPPRATARPEPQETLL